MPLAPLANTVPKIRIPVQKEGLDSCWSPLVDHHYEDKKK